MSATVQPGVLHEEDQDGGTELDIFIFEPGNVLDRVETWPTNGQFLDWAKEYVDVADISCVRHELAQVSVAKDVARRFVALGYCVYDGVNYFAIFEKGHCSLTWEALHVFPGYVALIAAVALVLAAWTAFVAGVLGLAIRRFRRT